MQRIAGSLVTETAYEKSPRPDIGPNSGSFGNLARKHKLRGIPWLAGQQLNRSRGPFSTRKFWWLFSCFPVPEKIR